MKMSAIINEYRDSFLAKHGASVLPGHLKALDAMRDCRTLESGELYVKCPGCDHSEWKPLSCGHRSCPQCQNHEASEWIDRQQEKLLPVRYFMLIPFAFKRHLRWHRRQLLDVQTTYISGASSLPPWCHLECKAE